MIFHYAGKYSGDESTLPTREDPPGAVPFKEPEYKKFALIANIGAIVVVLAAYAGFLFRARPYLGQQHLYFVSLILLLISLIPHEFLHAICFKGDVFMYHNLSKGLLFVCGPEDMSKAHFIFMSMLPNLVFGFIPYLVFMIHPSFLLLGEFGALSLGAGFGDYFNVFNALTQMPKGSRTYLKGFHSYWYPAK